MKPNSNCLAGMRCPKCGSFGPFLIEVQTVARVDDVGVDETRDIEWDDSSTISCEECSEDGRVTDFKLRFSFIEDETQDVIDALRAADLDQLADLVASTV